MIISMFDKSKLAKGLRYASTDGKKEEPHIQVNVKTASYRATALIHKDDAWIYNEPNKDRGELNRLESWFRELIGLAQVNRNAVFHMDLPDVSDDIAWRVALYQVRLATTLGLDLTIHNLHKLREYICDSPNGVDDVLDMKPFEKPKQVVGEYEASIDGHKFSGDLKD